MIKIIKEYKNVELDEEDIEKVDNVEKVEDLQDYLISELKYVDTPLSYCQDVIYDSLDNGEITRKDADFLLNWLEEVK